MFLCMIRARDVYYRVLERNERGITGGGYNDHANTVFMIGCPRVNQVHWILGQVPSILMGLDSGRIVGNSSRGKMLG